MWFHLDVNLLLKAEDMPGPVLVVAFAFDCFVFAVVSRVSEQLIQ